MVDFLSKLTKPRVPLFEDGVTHINCYSKGKTPLGCALSNFALSPFELPDHGKFASVEGYWYWLGNEFEQLRTMHGLEAKQEGQAIVKAWDYRRLSDFEFQVKRGILAKIVQRPVLAEEVRASTLPFEHYYVDQKGVPIFLPQYRWMMDWLEEIRRALKASPAPAPWPLKNWGMARAVQSTRGKV